jgi:hypothetical protein
VSAGRKAGHRQVSFPKDVERVIGNPEEETFDVGFGKSVYIPGAARLTGNQLEELLHKERETAREEAKRVTKTNTVSKEKLDDLKGGLRSLADWRRRRRQSK